MYPTYSPQQDVYNYNDIEKMAPKVGIPYPSVKDVLTSLKDDSLVEC